MKTTGEVLNEIRIELEEDTTIPEDEREWSDAMLLVFLNDGYRYVRKIIKESNPDMISHYEELFFAADDTDREELEYELLEIPERSVYNVTDGRYMYPGELKDFFAMSTNSITHFTTLGTKTFVVNCVPDTNTEIKILYIKSAQTLEYDTATDTEIDLIDEVIPYVKEYALLRAWNKTEAKAEIESMFMQRSGFELRKMLEDRTPLLMGGTGPWVV